MAQSSEIIRTSTESESVSDAKLLFSNLIVLPLEDLVTPENEASMNKVLSILAENLSVFSEEQAKQVLELKFNFPILLQKWRKFSLSKMCCSEKLVADLEEFRDLVGILVDELENLQVRYGELDSKEKELMAKLESVWKQKAQIRENFMG